MTAPEVLDGGSVAAGRPSRALFASWQEPAPPGKDAPRADDERTARDQSPGDEPPKEDQSERVDSGDHPGPHSALTYTAPGLPYQQLAVAVTIAGLGTVANEQGNLGRELSESVALTDAGPIGRLGLTAPPTRLAGRITSRPGLQEGPATGLGFVAGGRNIFAPQINRLSGPTGRCRDLARAGFFGGSRSACEQSLRRR